MTCIKNALDLSQLELICDSKEGWDSNVYRLNDEKLLNWLRAKVSRISKALASHPSFRLSNTAIADDDSSGMISHAIGLLSEYLAADNLASLTKSYGMSVESITSKKKAAKSYYCDLTTADADTSNYDTNLKVVCLLIFFRFLPHCSQPSTRCVKYH